MVLYSKMMDGVSRMDPLIFPFVEQGNVKLAKSIVSRLTARNNQINSSSNNHNTSHSDVSKQFIPATIYFPFKEVDFSSLSNVCRPIPKSVNNSNHVTAKSILVLPKVSETVKRLYQRRPVKALHILVMSVNKMTVI